MREQDFGGPKRIRHVRVKRAFCVGKGKDCEVGDVLTMPEDGVLAGYVQSGRVELIPPDAAPPRTADPFADAARAGLETRDPEPETRDPDQAAPSGGGRGSSKRK